MLPGAGPVSVNITFEATGRVRFESETMVLGLEEVTADALDGGGVGLLRVIAKTGALLDSHGEVGADHSLEVA